MAGKSHHVVPNPDGGWDVKKGGAERASGHFDRHRGSCGDQHRPDRDAFLYGHLLPQGVSSDARGCVAALLHPAGPCALGSLGLLGYAEQSCAT